MNASAFSLLPALLLAATAATAQAPAPAQLPTPRNVLATYAKGTRSPDGKPGPNYWQNTADYTLKVSFDPATRRVAGTVAATYRNNSPDSLRQLWLKLYPNYYQAGAPRDGKVASADLSDGMRIEQLTVNGQPVPYTTDFTNLTVSLPRAIRARQAAQVSVTYSYTLNKGSHQRTGEVMPGAAFLAYFFPRIAVYDDLDGWNKLPYTGAAEFYNDFASFVVDVTVPRNYLVWATGELTNADQVLTKKYLERLRTAERQDGITTIIDSVEARRHDATAPGATTTWHFEARDVTDFAFAASDHYVWQASSLVVDPATRRRTRVDAVYDARHRDYQEVVGFARRTVEAMSYTFPRWPYPYSHETVFDGLDQMEYPMLVNDNPTATREDGITLTDHEIFHTMFPFYMGVNETKYGWMDEGWATIGEWLISPLIDPAIRDDYGMAPYAQVAGTELDLPITTLTYQQKGSPFFLNSYPKPGLGYLYVRDLLGDELFTQALHRYIQDWHGRHPLPNDFFYSMNAGAGQNLNWFWQRWFFETGTLDLAIADVRQASATQPAQVTVANPGGRPQPIDLTVTFDDGRTETLHRTIAGWQSASTITVPVAGRRPIKKVTLGSLYIPDSHPADNVWPAAGR